jgi:hypothetical protein
MNEKQTVQGGFVMGRTDNSNSPNKVKNVIEVKTYLIQYNDKEGKEQVQLAFHVPGTDSVSLLKQQIQGQKVAAPSTDWLTKQFLEVVQKSKAQNGGKAEQL